MKKELPVVILSLMISNAAFALGVSGGAGSGAGSGASSATGVGTSTNPNPGTNPALNPNSRANTADPSLRQNPNNTNPTGSTPNSTNTDTTNSIQSSTQFQNIGSAATDIPNSGTVLNAQQALITRGYAINPDGVSGPATLNAIRQFQSQNGLSQSGVLDADTLKALSVQIERN